MRRRFLAFVLFTIAAVGAWRFFNGQSQPVPSVGGARTIIKVRSAGHSRTRVAGVIVDHGRRGVRLTARSTPFEVTVSDEEFRGTFVAWDGGRIVVEMVRISETGARQQAMGWSRAVSAFYHRGLFGVRTL
jgi:hypothetical protein